MVDADVLRRKTGEIIRRCGRLRARQGLDGQAMRADEDLANTVLMDLQQAIQASIDLAIHVCVDEALGTADTPAQAFEKLAQARRVPSELATRLAGAAGLRNLIVHQYTALDYDRVVGVIHHDLGDLERFAALMSGLADSH